MGLTVSYAIARRFCVLPATADGGDTYRSQRSEQLKKVLLVPAPSDGQNLIDLWNQAGQLIDVPLRTLKLVLADDGQRDRGEERGSVEELCATRRSASGSTSTLTISE